MTQDQIRAAIKKAIEAHTKRVTRSRSAARKSLIDEGVYTKDGLLAPEYGGK